MAKQKKKVGTFERIRQISPYAFGFFAVMLVAFFTIGDQTVVDGIMGGKSPQNIAIGTVNGEEITYYDYEQMVKKRIEQQKAMQKDTEKEVKEKKVRNDVWNELVDQMLIKQVADDNGIMISDKIIAHQMIENPPDYLRRAFTDSAGRFNRQVYVDLITNPEHYVNYMGEDPSQIPPEKRRAAVEQLRNDLLEIENYLRKQLHTQSLTTMVNTAGKVISPTFARNQYIAKNSKATADFVYLPLNTVKNEEIKVSEEEIKEYYDKNKRYFEQQPKRKIRYLSIPLKPSKSDSVRAEKRIKKIYEELKENPSPEKRDSIFDVKLSEYGGESFDFTLVKDIDRNTMSYLMGMEPRQVLGPITMRDGTYFFRLDARREGEAPAAKARHILIRFGNDKDSARALAISLLRRAKSGDPFPQLAQEFSADPGSASRGGDLGWFSKGEMVKPFSEAVFSADPGDIVGPVETQFGYHIIKVDDIQSIEFKYSELKIAPKITGVTRNKLFRDAYSFKKQIEEGAGFAGLAEKLGYRFQETPFFTKERPILGSRYLTDKIFNADVGTVIEPTELDYYGLVVVEVVGQRKAGIAPLEDVKAKIRQRLGTAKKLDKIKPKAEKIYNHVTTADSIGAARQIDSEIKIHSDAGIKGDGSITDVGSDQIMASAALEAPIGKIVGPIRGEKGYYIIKVKDRSIPDEKMVDKELPFFFDALTSTQRGNTFYQWFNNAKKEADVEDFRFEYYKEY
jgi:peptidylprolyl isomerase/peptidyl-prolyl cis-trans isomerase D